MKRRIFPKPNLSLSSILVLVALFALGLGLRVLDLTDPPLDFHATRQLHAAIIARGMYYQMLPSADPALRAQAILLWKAQETFEPPIFERLVALNYLLAGGEHLWFARIYSALFWLVGGAALFGLARRMLAVQTTATADHNGEAFAASPAQTFLPAAGALAALAYYLVLPYGVTASRSFQPDPMMVMWILLSAYTLFRWGEAPTWKWVVLSGIFGGLAILTKVVAAFPVLAVLLALALASLGLRKMLKNMQFWAMFGLMVFPPAIYYLLTILRRSEGMASGILPLTVKLLQNPKFYTGWFGLLGSIVGLSLVVIGLMGSLLLPAKSRALMMGLWGGFGLYGLVFAYPVSTHDYYNLPLIPIVALSLAITGAWLIGKAAELPPFWKIVFAGVIIFAIGYPSWLARSSLLGVNYRNEIKGWQKMGAELPNGGPIIALSHDYGNRLQYYAWRLTNYWPTVADIDLKALQGDKLSADNFRQYFEKQIKSRKYFLITLIGELNAQPMLKSMLYDHYTLLSESKGYILFDLSRPIQAP
jgi:4-amino-4-deoxy-L-arabinose transferase-like glycosyltransferase